jgi:hypothetical protein
MKPFSNKSEFVRNSQTIAVANTYYPDKWVVIKLSGGEVDGTPYKVFGCWYGGYMGSDSWKVNSGITKVVFEDGIYTFDGVSGSSYKCPVNGYGLSSYGVGVLNRMISASKGIGVTIEILPEDFDFRSIA